MTGFKHSQLPTDILQKKNYNAIMGESEKVPDWLTKGIAYLLPKLGDNREVTNDQTITSL